MPNVSMWRNVQIAIESALATAISVGAGGVTKASPGVMTYTGTDPSNGDYLKIAAQGMFQIDKRVIRAANVNGGGNTLELEGEDTTLYGTMASASAQVITFGTTLSATLGLSASGGGFKMEDITTIHDARSIEIPGNANALGYTLDNIWDVSDAGLKALKYASDNQIMRAMQIKFANGQMALFTGYVAYDGLPRGSAPGKVTTPAVITLYGAPTYYAS